jgi:hypothetical protein
MPSSAKANKRARELHVNELGAKNINLTHDVLLAGNIKQRAREPDTNTPGSKGSCRWPATPWLASQRRRPSALRGPCRWSATSGLVSPASVVLLEEVTTSGPGLVSPDFDNTYTTTYGAREPCVVLSTEVTTSGPGLASPDFDNTYTMAYGLVSLVWHCQRGSRPPVPAWPARTSTRPTPWRMASCVVLLEEVTTSGQGLVSPDFDNTYTMAYGRLGA